jgi:hypothetical protein
MSPIVTTNSSPAGRVRRVAAPAGGGGGVTPFFADSYAGGTKNPANGFTYTDANGRVTVTSADAYDADGYSLAIVCGPNGAFDEGEQATIESNRDLGQYTTKLWHEFYMLVPSNYTHRKRSGYADNNKLYQWYKDTYGSLGAGTVQYGAELWAVASDGTTQPRSRLRMMVRLQDGSFAPNYVADAPGTHDVEWPILVAPEGPVVPGVWTRIRVQIESSSAFGVSDGTYKLWAGDTLMYDGVNLPLHDYYDDSDQSFRRCHFFGSANSGYVDETIFRFDKESYYLTDPGW